MSFLRSLYERKFFISFFIFVCVINIVLQINTNYMRDDWYFETSGYNVEYFASDSTDIGIVILRNYLKLSNDTNIIKER